MLAALPETSWHRTWLLVGLFAVALVTTTASEIWRYPTALGILGGTLTAFAALGLTAAAFTSRSRAPTTASDLYHRLVVRLVALTHAGGVLLILAMSAAAQSDTDATELGAVIVVVVSATVWLTYFAGHEPHGSRLEAGASPDKVVSNYASEDPAGTG